MAKQRERKYRQTASDLRAYYDRTERLWVYERWDGKRQQYVIAGSARRFKERW